MDLIWTALVLGLVGSAHCAGMCGPIALALPVVGSSRVSFAWGRLLYNLGRLAAYCAVGIAFGMLGRSLALAGFQRWVSLAAGAVLLIGLGLAPLSASQAPVWRAVAGLKRVFGTLLTRRTFASLFVLGALNGLLPCGLVYVAAAGATATGSLSAGILYMLAFGLGTLPVMLGFALAAKRFQFRLRFRLQKLIPISIACLGILLLLRGMALGIPYLSPDIGVASISGSCH